MEQCTSKRTDNIVNSLQKVSIPSNGQVAKELCANMWIILSVTDHELTKITLDALVHAKLTQV